MKKRWTADEMPDQTDRRVVITGGAGGIGLAAAKVFAAKGAEVLIGVRDAPKGEQAIAAVKAGLPQAKIAYELLDLASLASVQRFSAALLATGKPIDVLVNCAGVMAIAKREETQDGFEMHFGVNHLGHFALTGRLLPALRKSKSARVITVSSQAARSGKLDLSDLQVSKKYSPMDAYGKSKLANILFAVELNRRVGAAGIISIPVHPGTANTQIQRNLASPILSFLGRLIMKLVGQPLEHVAEPIVFAATTERATGESYIAPTGIFELGGPTDFVKLPAAALDADLRAGLWRESEKLTGVRYTD